MASLRPRHRGGTRVERIVVCHLDDTHGFTSNFHIELWMIEMSSPYIPLKTVRVMCPQCDGSKIYEELTYPDRKKIYVKCQSCEGKGYVLDDLPD